ncbi:MAG: 3-oxoadipate enol-lactonase [Rhodospirillales bacterium]|nr:MAG: 3-oxoadipate enol-lactonase [Rhodospirillales bacterium]
MQFTRINDIVLHYSDTGTRPGAPTLVLSNSLGTDFRAWDRLTDELAARFRILRYDKRGHGLSQATPAPYSIDDHVADLIGLLDHLALDHVVLCGLSVGGLIAQGLAARQPERLQAMILADTAAKIGSAELWGARIAAIEAGGIEAIADAIMERWLSAAFREGRPAESAGWRNMLVRTPTAGYLGTCAAIRDADFSVEAVRIAVPTLCLVGSEDGATPPDLVRETAALIPGAQFAVIDGAGHLPCIEQPAVMASLITSFLEEHGLV